MQSTSSISSLIWSTADDDLRGLFKPSEYGRVILPFVVMRRLDCVLESKKDEVYNLYQKFKDQLLDEIQDTFSDKKNPTLLEYQQQTENLITLKELLEREKESMPQENFDLISGQDFVILQIERWIDENNEIIDGWFEESDQPLKKH